MPIVDYRDTAGGCLDKCGHCGCMHIGRCQRIKAIEYHEDGRVKRVEYHDERPLPVYQPYWSITPPIPVEYTYTVTC